MLGGIEAGGTKFICAVADRPDGPLEKCVIPTTSPDETLGAVREFFRVHGALDALGIASFGPVDIDPTSPQFGEMLNTPKPGWAGVSYLDAFESLDCPIHLDTDVNGAGLAEWQFGAGQGSRTLAYVTVGTGIGTGVLRDGQSLSGAGHYEMGHIRPVRDGERDPFEGACPFHGDCLEGLASGPAIKARWGMGLDVMADLGPAIELIGGYLAQLALSITLTHRPDRILFGGGVMKTPGLIDVIREQMESLLAGYVYIPSVRDYIAAPSLGDDAGITGALCLAVSVLPGAEAGPRHAGK